MADDKIPMSAQVARTVLDKTLHVKRGENITVETWSDCLPFARSFIQESRRKGAHPMLLYEDEPTFWESLDSGAGKTTGIVGDHEWAALSKTSAYVFFFGPAEWPRINDLPEKKLKGVAAYNPEWYKRAARAKVRGARMYIGRTSESSARRFGVNLEEWREDLTRGSLVPPAELHRLGTRVAERLRTGKSVSVSHSNGTDLTFRLGRLPIQLDDAMVDEADVRAGNNVANIPGGVVGLALDDSGAEGSIRGNHDVYPDAANGPVRDLHWSFHDGRLSDHSFGDGGEKLEAAYLKAPKAGRDRLSYLSIGLNPELSHSPQMEDQEIGAVLVRIGGNSFVGGKNASPFGAWLVVKGADVAVDGRPLLEDGRII